jgi:hypothetical protein
MSSTYTTAGKTQVFLKASLAGMNARRVDDMLIVEAPEGFAFNNGSTSISYDGERGSWAKTYGAALTEMSKPLITITKRKFSWSKR